MLHNLEKEVESLWNQVAEDNFNKLKISHAQEILDIVINKLDSGEIRACKQISQGKWEVNLWVKKAILLFFKIQNLVVYDNSYTKWCDKIPAKFAPDLLNDDDFINYKCRVVPGAYVRKGSFIDSGTILMPSFVNIGAYIGKNTMIDTWSTIGSCAQIGNNCHISGGVGIGGVLEPLQNSPVIIEDNCFIGARSEIAEGVIVEEGAVVGMGVFISASTKIIDRETGQITYGRVPAYSVVVSGSLPTNAKDILGAQLYCAVIVKKVDSSTRKKTSLNELLRF